MVPALADPSLSPSYASLVTELCVEGGGGTRLVQFALPLIYGLPCLDLSILSNHPGYLSCCKARMRTETPDRAFDECFYEFIMKTAKSCQPFTGTSWVAELQ